MYYIRTYITVLREWPDISDFRSWLLMVTKLAKCKDNAGSSGNDSVNKVHLPSWIWQKRVLTFSTSKGQIHVRTVMNNYLNNWAFNGKIDCIKAVFCWESISENHFSSHVTYCVFINFYSLRCMILRFFVAWSLPCMKNCAVKEKSVRVTT